MSCTFFHGIFAPIKRSLCNQLGLLFVGLLLSPLCLAATSSDIRIRSIECYNGTDWTTRTLTQRCGSAFPGILGCDDALTACGLGNPPVNSSATNTSVSGTITQVKYQTSTGGPVCARAAGQTHCWTHSFNGTKTTVTYQGVFPDQDNDSLRDDYDLDDDRDSVPDTSDNCASIYNPDQLNSDGDSEGNACDTDDDNDGVADASDAFPLDASESLDTDGDGVGNNSDSTPNGDTDNDGIDNLADNCAAVANSDQLNTDGDSEGNACDNDDDNDGVDDASDAFPINPEATTDTDGDGKPDSIDTTKLPVFNDFESGDGGGWVFNSWYETAGASWGVSTKYSVSPSHSLRLITYRDASHSTNVASLSISLQTGSTISWYQRGASSLGVYGVEINGIPAYSSCTASGVWSFCVVTVTPGTNTFAMKVNSGTPPMTGSYAEMFIDDLRIGSPLIEDTDDDNDGVADASDAFPLDASESVDADGDGIGDNSDAFPNDPDESADADNDGVGNNSDNCAAVSNSNQLDWDNNGIGDACDAPVPVPSDVDGTAKAEKTGAAVAFAGDFDGDGYGDYVIGSPGYSVRAAPPAKAIVGVGKAEVISGKDGSVMASITGNAAKDAMGFAVAGNADIDKDGFADVVVGAPNATALRVGSVTVLYGGAGERRHTFWGAMKNTGFGSALALGDVNGDGYADVLIGAPKDKSPVAPQKAAGSVTVYDGNSLQSRKRFYGLSTNAHAGTAVAAGDVDNDGVADIIVGAPDESGVGSVRAYNSSGTELLQKLGTNKKARFGKALASADINHDGYTDIVIGAPLDDDADSRTKDTGSISVISGSDGELLSTKSFGAVKKAWLGSSVALGDVNGDSTLDIIAGAPQDNNIPAATNDTGSVTVWNGATYAPIKTVYGDAFGDLFGAAVSTGDINSDGKADLIIGIPNQDVELESSVQKDAGGVKVINATAL
ncbi:MAG: FG-GAP repeat protein [Cellvibrionales bacterium]|nr:FG-GAP repeat protein [Cellvibrionales bacterium]